MARQELNSNTPVASTSTANKNTVAELKNGKVIFKQKPISFEKASETMQEIVKFREMLDQRVESQDQPLTSIPDEHKPLIVKLAQESDKGVVPLAKHIRSILLPGQGEVEDAHRASLESCLPLPVVEHAIKMVMTRTNYGLDGALGQKIPAAVCVWRWEVQAPYKEWLPKSAKEKVEARVAERDQACKDLRAAFENLPQAERDAILDPKGANKLPVKDTNKSEAAGGGNPVEDQVQKELPATAGESEQSENVAPKGRAKKAADPEKVAKVKEKEERKAAKAEKEKKQKEAQDKSRSLMASFVVKAKPSIRDSPTKDFNAVAGPSTTENDFQRTFKPFVLKKDAELAPYNWFMETKKMRTQKRTTGATHGEAIVVDDDASGQADPDVNMLSREQPNPTPETIRDFVQSLRSQSLSCPRRRKASSLKTYNARTVRDTLTQLNDAEIAGDPSQVRHLLSVLNDRKVLPAKVLIFHEDARPGYYGTWTRNSRIVGPRTPFERDVLARDYGYDSGEEWEDEGAGEADDVVEDGEDEDGDGDDADSDLDSWLVDDDDDDDDEVPASSPCDPRDLSPSLPDLPMPPPPKRKAENAERQPEKKRKVVVPLVPYTKGPFWESTIGQCEYDPFDAYRIQLFNDTPYPIDPFTFVSVAAEERQNVKPDATFAVPSLPHKVLSNAGSTGSLAPPALKRAGTASTPKTPFPDTHIAALLAKITNLATPSLTFLVESIYQDLRVHKVKKNAIEAKVREVGEKSKDKKVWIVKQAVRSLHGLA
ncbi:hypothetical protein HYDPIDRAFT_105932 [Hydnomerulius pinastri MD-312]|nr:hypothetical protein HYDPIDRAFT_105932 [Hydnomerulius pinastri MD-312]